MLMIQKPTFKVIVRPNAKKNEISIFDKEKHAYRISIKAPAEHNKANIELIKFLSKELKKKVQIIRGFHSKEKIIKIIYAYSSLGGKRTGILSLIR